jgi:hypothetical protein
MRYSERDPHLPILPHSLAIKIRASLRRIERHADLIDFKLQLDPIKVAELAERGYPDLNIRPFNVHHEPRLVKWSPYVSLYGKYDTETPEFYYIQPGESSPFTTGIRLKILASIVRTHTSQGEWREPRIDSTPPNGALKRLPETHGGRRSRTAYLESEK